MKNSKLVKALMVLDAAELKQLLQFLKSPLFNSSKTIINLYLLLRTEHPYFDSPKLSTERVFKKLYPKKPYDHKKMINLMSEFKRLLEKYLMILALEEDEIQQQKLLVQSFAQRSNAYALFKRQSSFLHKKLDALPYRDEIYFQEKKNLYLSHYAHSETNRDKEDKEIFKLALENFKAFKNIAEVKLRCAENARINLYKENKIYDSLKGESAVLEIYEKLNHLQQSDVDDNQLTQLTNSFINSIHQFRVEDQLIIIKILLNYHTRFVNKGKTEYLKQIFLLYKTGLLHNCLFPKGQLTATTFQNIISTAMYCEEYEWAKQFIDDNQHQLESDKKEDVLALGMAQWYYKTGNLKKALEVLEYSFKEVHIAIRTKILQIRISYELIDKEYSYFDLLSNQLDAFEKYIRREKTIKKDTVERNLTFIRYVRSLINNNKNTLTMKKTRTELVDEQNVALKDWLLEKYT